LILNSRTIAMVGRLSATSGRLDCVWNDILPDSGGILPVVADRSRKFSCPFTHSFHWLEFFVTILANQQHESGQGKVRTAERIWDSTYRETFETPSSRYETRQQWQHEKRIIDSPLLDRVMIHSLETWRCQVLRFDNRPCWRSGW